MFGASQDSARGCFPKESDGATQALMLIRFNEKVFLTCKNSLVKQNMVTQNYGGKVIGLIHAKDVSKHLHYAHTSADSSSELRCDTDCAKSFAFVEVPL